MTNPNDPWSMRPQGQPTEQFGEPGPYQHTSDPYQAYGYVPDNATQGYPTYQYDPNKPNPTQALPTYQGGQYGTHPSEAPLGWQGNQPPKRSNTSLYIALAVCGILLLAVIGVGALLLRGGGDDSSTTAAATSTPRTAPTLSLPQQTPGAPPTGDLTVPGLPGLGDLGATMGAITANDGSTLTIDAITGGSVTVRTNDQTQVIALSGTTVADLKVGESVVVQGDSQGSGTILAELIVSMALPDGGGFGN